MARLNQRNASGLREEVLAGDQVIPSEDHTTHIKRNIICKGLSESTASSQTFTFKEESGKREISVAKYFVEKYGIKLEYPNLPRFSRWNCYSFGRCRKLPIID